MEKKFLNTREVAKMLNVTPLTVKMMVNKGKLPGFKIGGVWRFDEDEIVEWVKAGKAAK